MTAPGGGQPLHTLPMGSQKRKSKCKTDTNHKEKKNYELTYHMKAQTFTKVKKSRV